MKLIDEGKDVQVFYYYLIQFNLMKVLNVNC